MSESRVRKSSRREKAAESLTEHFDVGDHSAPVEGGYDDDDVAESWSSQDISAGVLKASVRNRRSSVNGSSSTTSGSRQRQGSSSRLNVKEGRARSPTGNSVKSDRSSQSSQHRSGSSRHMHSPTGSTRSASDSVKSPYKGLAKLAVADEGTPSRSARKASTSSGIPRTPAGSGLPSPRKTSAHHRMSAAAGNSSISSGISSSSNSRRKSEAGQAPSTDKLQRILELGNQWKTMKQQHEIAAQQAASRRVDLTKEIF